MTVRSSVHAYCTGVLRGAGETVQVAGTCRAIHAGARRAWVELGAGQAREFFTRVTKC